VAGPDEYTRAGVSAPQRARPDIAAVRTRASARAETQDGARSRHRPAGQSRDAGAGVRQ